MTSGAVSATKGAGAGRQAGPAAASVISAAAPISRSGARRPAAPFAPDGERREQVWGDLQVGRRRRGILPAQQQPQRGQRQQRQQHQRPQEGEGGERRHAGAFRRRRRRAARSAPA